MKSVPVVSSSLPQVSCFSVSALRGRQEIHVEVTTVEGLIPVKRLSLTAVSQACCLVSVSGKDGSRKFLQSHLIGSGHDLKTS